MDAKPQDLKTPVVVPTILAETPQEFGAILQGLSQFSTRVHIDIADGQFAPNSTISLAQAYWPETIQADLHLMINQPGMRTELCISLNPHMVIIHAEASDHGYETKLEMIKGLKSVGIKTGLAILPHTAVQTVEALVAEVDHVLVFTGNLGFYGGDIQLDALSKIPQLKAINRDVEIGVDGGVNDTNIAEVIAAGADVLNVGSYIQKADDPKSAYAKLVQITKS